VLCLVGLAVLSTAIRAVLGVRVHAPTVFSDELGYMKLAQSIGRTGRIAVLDNEGLSFSPLYPLVLSPIYALGASVPTAYDLAKVVNAALMSAAVFPIYGIARLVLTRRLALLAALLSTLAPLMIYSGLTVSENLAYPLGLVAVWALLRAVCRPSVVNDALALGAILIAAATRAELLVLVPTALTAIPVATVLGRKTEESVGACLVRAAKEHVLLVATFGGAALIGVIAGVGGQDALAPLGRYAVVGRSGLPPLSEFLDVLLRHIAGLSLAVGVVPFVGSLAVAYAFARSSSRSTPTVAFAAVASAMTVWLLLVVAFDAALIDLPHGADAPRIHERFLIYVVPLFLIGLLAAYRPLVRKPSGTVYVAAALATGLLPLLIPFHTVANQTSNYESFVLHPFTRVVNGNVIPAHHATLQAIWICATLGLLFAYMRGQLRTVVVLVLLAFLGVSTLARQRFENLGNVGRALVPAHADWVDRADASGRVVLVTGAPEPDAEKETAYFNGSIDGVYFACSGAFGSEFGEQPIRAGSGGLLRTSSGPVEAAYAVVPVSLPVRGRVVASNRAGKEVLVALEDGRLSLRGSADRVRCPE
jgi:hypothetical protein